MLLQGECETEMAEISVLSVLRQANIWWTRNVRNGTFFKTHPILEVAVITL